MKYSVLLPTRNGGRLLKNCIASVLDQSYEDVELVVVNNASTDDTHEVVSMFSGDRRLKYIRLDEGVPVTENWNNALHASEGEYFVMIGDDDCLLPGYFDTLDRVLDHYDWPECVIYDVYLYVFPNAVSGNTGSYYSAGAFNMGSVYPGIVPKKRRTDIVRGMFQYRELYVTNMQSALVSRRVAERMAGGIFQPPFPDFYARLALLIEAETLVGVPIELAVVGVSPKSHGHYFYNNRRAEGMTYLGIDTAFEGRLPGSTHNDCVFLTLQRLEKSYAPKLDGVRLGRGGYVRAQIIHWLSELQSGMISPGELVRRSRLIRPEDWLRVLASVANRRSVERIVSRVRRRPKSRVVLPAIAGVEFTPLPEVGDIREFVQWEQNVLAQKAE